MKRRIVKLTLFLLLGTILNIAAAWTCAWWRFGDERTATIGFPSSEDAWLRSIGFDPANYDTTSIAQAEELNAASPEDEFSIASAPTDADVIATSTAPDGSTVLPIRGTKKHWNGNIVFNEHVVDPDGELTQAAARTFGFEERTFWHGESSASFPGALPFAQQYRGGWPARSLYGYAVWPSNDRAIMYSLMSQRTWFNYHWVLLPSGEPPPDEPPWQLFYQQHSGVRALPLLPLWPGFAINTIFYAAILWMLFAAPFAWRRRRRIKRGLCPACAYPIGASEVCTECGKALKG